MFIVTFLPLLESNLGDPVMGGSTDWYQRGIASNTYKYFQHISPPKDNNNDATIENFIGELTPVITDLGKGNNTALAVGDFNINPLQLNEREKYNDFLELMCTNSFYHKITPPIRFSNKSCSLIDQIYCKPTLPISAFSSKIVIRQLSDHFPCIVSIKLLREKNISQIMSLFVLVHAVLSMILKINSKAKSQNWY